MDDPSRRPGRRSRGPGRHRERASGSHHPAPISARSRDRAPRPPRTKTDTSTRGAERTRGGARVAGEPRSGGVPANIRPAPFPARPPPTCAWDRRARRSAAAPDNARASDVARDLRRRDAGGPSARAKSARDRVRPPRKCVAADHARLDVGDVDARARRVRALARDRAPSRASAELPSPRLPRSLAPASRAHLRHRVVVAREEGWW